MLIRRVFAIGAALGLFAAGWCQAAAGDAPVEEQRIEHILKTVAPSVVKVEARNGIRKVATGVVIDKDGTIVTTALISPRDEKITILTFEGREYTADFKGFDLESGLAVIQVKNKGLPAISLGQTGDARPGAWTGAVGFSPENTPAITQGIVSSVTDERLRLNLWVMPGASGSPVVNSEGRMTGVLRGTYVDEQPFVFTFQDRQYTGRGTVISRAQAPSSGMSVAVPVDIVLSVAGDIKKNGKVLRGWIGIDVLESEGRLEIVEVKPKSPAELAKLKEGDLIVRIDGSGVDSGADFSREIRKRKPGQDALLGIHRNGEEVKVMVKVGEYTEEEGRRELESRFTRLFPPPLEDQVSVFKTLGGRNRLFFGPTKNIGMSLQELTRELAVHFGSKEGLGLLVTHFPADSPAEKAGLKVGDVLVKADGRDLETIDTLFFIMDRKKAGEKITFEILRERKTITIEVPVVGD
ncbi:MAG: PDZ domain-containing protein [Candidatus Aminicenantes bacterium]|nr:PDZ domain-containing protein [Candidatus Aminicenantes bacterium]